MVTPFRFGSVCSGYDAASLAFCGDPLNWECAFVAEHDPLATAKGLQHAQAVLAERWKGTPNLGDITRYKEWDDYAIDLLIGGTPCQGLSIAGLRKGLDDPRSSLMLVYGAIAARYRSSWLLWENVPGVLSIDDGRGFATFLGLLSGRKIDAPPEGRWPSAGVIEGDRNAYGLAWRVLDAQYFGLAQRRARVFVVGYLGDWRPPAAVLIEPESMSGNPAPRRKAGESVAGTLGGSSQSGGFRTTDLDNNGAFIVEAFGGNNTRGPIDVATAVRAHGGAGHFDFESETFLVEQEAWSITPSNSNKDFTGRVAEKAQTVTTQTGMPPAARGGDVVVMGFTTKDHGQDAAEEVAPTLRAMNDDSSHPNGGGQVGVAYAFDTTQVTNPDNRSQPADVSHALGANQHPPAVAMNLRGREGGAMPELDDLASIRAADGGSSRSYVVEYVVRRLTPKECERLQGAPDDFTRVTYRGKPMADSPRYKMLGNSFAVNTVRWIGERIELVRGVMADSNEWRT